MILSPEAVDYIVGGLFNSRDFLRAFKFAELAPVLYSRRFFAHLAEISLLANDRFAPEAAGPLESGFDHFGNRGEYAVSPVLAFPGSP